MPSDDLPRLVVLDAGPIIGMMDVRDEHHMVSTRGFAQLRSARSRMLLPVPILYEVYKHTAYTINLRTARRALEHMRVSFDHIYVDETDLEELHMLLALMPWWGGSLEDATIAMVGLSRDIPVWTFNYRDLRAFPNLQFWTPA
jgi:predicted nucleic acid-binding protein